MTIYVFFKFQQKIKKHNLKSVSIVKCVSKYVYFFALLFHLKIYLIKIKLIGVLNIPQ